jgi:hypothetical protein
VYVFHFLKEVQSLLLFQIYCTGVISSFFGKKHPADIQDRNVKKTEWIIIPQNTSIVNDNSLIDEK